jgi:small redox-active disulfide protein 2
MEATMKIQILGGGCPKCQKLAENAKAAVSEIGIDAEIEKVTDTDRIMDMGVMITPALAVDGVVKSTGKVLDKSEIVGLIGGK